MYEYTGFRRVLQFTDVQVEKLIHVVLQFYKRQNYVRNKYNKTLQKRLCSYFEYSNDELQNFIKYLV